MAIGVDRNQHAGRSIDNHVRPNCQQGGATGAQADQTRLRSRCDRQQFLLLCGDVLPAMGALHDGDKTHPTDALKFTPYCTNAVEGTWSVDINTHLDGRTSSSASRYM